MNRLLLLFAFLPCQLLAQQSRVIEFPNVPGYQTMVVDLHMHSVFSDGSVWPDIRVYEAVRDGVDLIATTEHLEYQPHDEDIPHPNRNRSFELASKIAEQENLIVVNGAEITRDMPPGHSNAVFIDDANPLLQDDYMDAFSEAKKQGAFIFWNHPMWASQYNDGVARLTDVHRTLIADGMLHGIEVVNDLTFSVEALKIALDNNLTILGTSDIHGLVDWQYKINEGGHRPVTMVFSTTRTAEGVKEALFAGRTAVWFNNLLVGKPENLVPLIEASLEVASAKRREGTSIVSVVIRNSTGVNFLLQNISAYTFHANDEIVEIAPRSETVLQVKTLEDINEFTLRFKVLNGIVAPKTPAEISIDVEIN